MTITPDQLRWEITPIHWIAIDGAENIVVEVLGHRALIPDATVAIEALRQAQAAQRGDRPDAAVLAAEITLLAAQGRHDQVRQHITHAAEQQLLYGEEFHVIPRGTATELAVQIAADAMNGMGPMFTEAVTSLVGKVLGELTDHKVAGVQAITQAGYDVLAEASDRGAQLVEFARQVADLGDVEPADLYEASETFQSLAADARRLLGIPDPADPDPCSEADLDDPRARFRWNDHKNGRGHWCPFSGVPVTDKLAASDDKRCGHECPDSTIEPIPPADPAPPISPNGIGPSADQADPFGPDAYKSHTAGCECPDCRAARAEQA